ncbi:MAG: hypothetical protein HWE27_04430 [Gammaproteobacteria bacterium]|nr:hypothetical protein [Gammaproteobacteria bacterium]
MTKNSQESSFGPVLYLAIILFLLLIAYFIYLKYSNPIVIKEQSYSCTIARCEFSVHVMNVEETKNIVYLRVNALKQKSYGKGGVTMLLVGSERIEFVLEPNQSINISKHINVSNRPSRVLFLVGIVGEQAKQGR